MVYEYENFAEIYVFFRCFFFRNMVKYMITIFLRGGKEMKKLILKTAIITFFVTMIFAVSLFGIVSFFAPSAMMRFCATIGLENISGDYAYQAYMTTNEIDYLARAFEIAATNEKDDVAGKRFDELYGEADSEQRTKFSQYCTTQTLEKTGIEVPDAVASYDYRSAVCAQAAIVKSRTASSDEEKREVCEFAIEESCDEISADCPVTALASELSERNDGEFCNMLLNAIKRTDKFDTENSNYILVVNTLQEAAV